MSGQDTDNKKSKEIKLKELAVKMGVSTLMYRAESANAGETELANNIFSFLQTASMVDAARTASKNYIIAIIAAISAVISALAAWTAIYYK